jgi:phospholipase/carboxylesterase
LVPLAFEFGELLGESASRFQFIFPAAPHDLSRVGMPGGLSWWPINMAQLALAVQTERFSELHRIEPEGIKEATEMLVEAIAEISHQTSVTSSRLVLGGFSQGAMLAVNTVLRGLEHMPELLLLFSGTLVCKGAWKANMARLAGTPVFQSHGTRDPILPFESACTLRDLLGSGNVKVTFHAFDGPHTIDAGAVEKSAEMLGKVL